MPHSAMWRRPCPAQGASTSWAASWALPAQGGGQTRRPQQLLESFAFDSDSYTKRGLEFYGPKGTPISGR